jgi:DNA-binding IclR family transcriptional regulator
MTRPEGARSLLKSLDLLETVGGGASDLEAIVAATRLPRSTAHRLLTTLVRRGYLRHRAGDGYRLGPKLIELGFAAQSQLHLSSAARPHMERLARATSETVHLAVLDGLDVVYIDKVPGSRGLLMASTIGARAPAQTTALGKVLVAGLPEREWRGRFDPALRRTANAIADEACYLDTLRRCADRGYAEDHEENEPGVRCLGVPIRDAAGAVVAALSVSGANVYLSDVRLDEIRPLVMAAGAAVSAELGWREPAGGDATRAAPDQA